MLQEESLPEFGVADGGDEGTEIGGVAVGEIIVAVDGNAVVAEEFACACLVQSP